MSKYISYLFPLFMVIFIVSFISALIPKGITVKDLKTGECISDTRDVLKVVEVKKLAVLLKDSQGRKFSMSKRLINLNFKTECWDWFDKK